MEKGEKNYTKGSFIPKNYFRRRSNVSPTSAILILGFLQSILDKIQEMFPGLEEMKECQSV
jgi:hypothetical protein